LCEKLVCNGSNRSFPRASFQRNTKWNLFTPCNGLVF
jgi:hypothetical protein